MTWPAWSELSASPAPGQTAYRPISVWAVVSLILGCISAVTLIVESPMAWLAPVVAVAVSLAALWETWGAAAEKAGRTLAIAGLLLAVVFLSAGISRRELRRTWAAEEAEVVAQEWIEHVRHGRRRAAHTLSLAPSERCPADRPLSRCYREREDLQERLDKYVEEPYVRPMLLWGQQARYQLVDIPRRELFSSTDVVGLLYEVTVQAADSTPAELPVGTMLPPTTRPAEMPRYLRLLLERKHDPRSHQTAWRVVSGKLAAVPLDEN